ncbi:MAG: DNA polymerase IV [Nitrospirota bacterium]|nr:DNA polymerase IV [Nitrospirota bacterium]
MRRVLHIDMDAFFASVEEKRHPELKDKPIVIGGSGDPSKRGVVSTASYEARKYGVHSAMPLKTAYRLCPQAVFLPVDYNEYARISGIIKNILAQFSPVMEDVGIDEAFLDISGSGMSNEQIAREIKERIRRQTGLSCSIGIAPNKLLAKIASDMQKPDGLTVITMGDIESRIWPLPVRKLWGVGPKTEAFLRKIAVHTIGDLASLSQDDLVGQFGESYGHYLHEASHGIDHSPLITYWEPKSISRETTFQTDTDDWQTIARNLAELTRDTVDDLRGRGYKTNNVTVKIRFSDFQTQTRAKTIAEPTDNLEAIRKVAFQCLNRFELKKKVRLVGVRLGGLTTDEV